MSSGHPSDADREKAAAPVVDRVVAAIAVGDADALAECFSEGGVCLADADRIEGRDAIAAHLAVALKGPADVTRRQQHGAHAVLGWDGGLCVLEVRSAEIVFAALTATAMPPSGARNP